MLTIYSAINFIAAAVMWLFALVVYQGGPGENTRSYARYVGWTGMWALAMAVFLFIEPSNEAGLTAAVKLIYWVGTAIATSWFYFTLVYPDSGDRYIRVRRLFVALNVLLLGIYFASDLIIAGVSVGEKVFHRFPVYGPLWWPLFNGIFTFFLYGGFVILYRKWRAETDAAARARHARLFWSAVIAFTPGVLFAVIFIALAKNFEYYWVSPLLTLAWVIYVSYAIFRHSLFKIRVIAAELALLFVGLALFVNIFLDEITGSFTLLAEALTGGATYELSIYAIMIWIASLIVGVFGALIAANSKQSSTRIYAASAFAVALWGLGLGFYYFFSDPALVSFINRLNHSFGNLIAVTFFLFAYAYPLDRFPPRRALLSIGAVEILLIGAYLFSDIIIGPAFVRSLLDRGWELGPAAWIFYLHFTLFTIASFALLARKYLLARGTNVAGHILLITITSGIGFAFGGFTGLVLPALGHFLHLWTGPLSVLFWVAATAVAVLRYGVLNLRVLASEIFVFALIMLLFGNIFVSEISFSLRENLSPLREIGTLPIVIWVIAALLASHAIVLFFADRRPSTRALSATFAAATVWSAAIGAFYAAPTPLAALPAMRFINYFGGHVLVVATLIFAHQMGRERGLTRGQWLAILIAEPIIALAYLGSDLITESVMFTGADIVARGWKLGIIGIAHHLQIFGLSATSLYLLWKKRDIDYPYEPPGIMRSTFLVFLVLGAPAAFAFTIPRFLGLIAPNWLGPFFALGWAILSTIVVVRYRIGNIRIFLAEIFIVATLIILLANVFITELTFAFFARLGVFVAFVSAGIAFIYNVLRGERQRNELDALTMELAGLNTNLERIVDERTREIKIAAEHTTTVIENLHNGVIELTKRGDIARMNAAAERLLGIDRRALIGKRARRAASSTLANLEAVIAAVPGTDADVRLSAPIARELTVISSSLGNSGRTLRIIRDVTRERFISRSKSEFISIAAHQLRTPLSVIKWTLDILKLGDLGAITDRHRIMLNRADVTNERLISLVNDLLRVSRIDSGNEEYDRGPVDSVRLAKDSLHDLAPLASSKNLTLRYEMPDSPIPLVFADRDQLKYVFHNAAHNAILYTPTGGVIVLRARRENNFVIIALSDTGIGIPEQDQSRIFSKFFRSEQAVKIHTEGTGLSLFIMKHIMQKHGGDMTIVSRPGEGTTASFMLPETDNTQKP